MIVVVMGCARTGTSMIAGLLHEVFGVDMAPAKPKPGTEWANPKGGYENPFWIGMTVNLVSGKFPHNYVEMIQEHVKNRREPWGFKSAVTHHVIRDIHHLLPVGSKYIVTWRDIESHAANLKFFQKKNYGEEITEEQALKRVLVDRNKLDEAVRSLQMDSVLETSYHITKKHPEETVKRIAHFLRVELTPEMIRKTENFIEKDYDSCKSY